MSPIDMWIILCSHSLFLFVSLFLLLYVDGASAANASLSAPLAGNKRQQAEQDVKTAETVEQQSKKKQRHDAPVSGEEQAQPAS
jgi:hypothetical protein